ncbi:50S ribosomal protein L30e [Archaeoglobales archaeon]|nr:MAG: 50S ribosomal protein L30e [Archaeoglobales archaeon]
MTDVELLIKRVLKSGKYYLGSKKTLKALKSGEAKLVILSKNCPEEIANKIKQFDIPILIYDGTNVELGTLCGKPFSVSAMAITEEIE